jgi:hypothetical protein
MTYKFLGGLVVGGLMLLTPGSALAAKVSVEIEGQSVTQAPTVVDTAASVNKPGGAACTGAVPATALETAVGGDWDGQPYAVQRIRTEDRPFGPNGSWSFYINDHYSNDTICTASLAEGDKVLFYWSDAYANAGYDDPVFLDAPTTATPGQAFTATATDATTTFDGNGAGTTTLAPSAGATISGGSAAVTTGADGTAQVTVPGGPYTLVATKANRAPARIAGCATNGHDGFCGTTASSSGTTTTTTTAPAPAPCVTNGHDGFCGTSDRTPPSPKITAIAEGKRYAKGRGPRQLGGTVAADGSGVADVQLRLTRNDGGRCSTYDGRTERFKTIKKCGAVHGVWFSVGSKTDWTYLLPSQLGRGRYVLDVIAVDRAGNKVTSLARGTTRVVFNVA